MSEQRANRPTSETTSATPSGSAGGAPATTRTTAVEGPLASDQGTTSIADSVVSKIAGLAAREVAGVYRLGGGGVRALGGFRDRIPGARASVGAGVSVEVGQRQAAVDVDVIVEYGYPIAEVADAIRSSIISAIETLVGLEVTEVNIAVDDVHLPDDSGSDEQAESRVQ